MGLIDDLGPGPIGLDTAVFIYFVEEHTEFLALVEPLFVGLDGGRWSAVTSSLTLLETLVVPYRAGDTTLGGRYEALLSRSRGLRLVELDRPLLRAAAKPARGSFHQDTRRHPARRGARRPVHRVRHE